MYDDPRENAHRVGQRRMQQWMEATRKLKNIFRNRQRYEFTNTEIETMIDVFKKELRDLEVLANDRKSARNKKEFVF
jgi:hypothetical protein